MASIYDLKPGFQALLRPLVRTLAVQGVSANQVTLFAVLLSFTAGGAVALNAEEPRVLLIIPVALAARMALNAMDGMLAREHGMRTALGAILNELGDVLSDIALYLPLVLFEGIEPALVVLVVILGLLVEMVGIMAVQIGAERGYEGPMGKSDRAFAFGLIDLLLGMRWAPVYWVNYLFVLIAALLCLTMFNRAMSALKQAGR